MQHIKELMNQLREADAPTAFNLLFQLTDSVLKATRPGAENERQAMAAAIRTELSRTEEAPPTRRHPEPRQVPVYSDTVQGTVIIRLLQYVAGDAEIPFLVEATKNLRLRESARCALAYNPSPAATRALIDALDEVGPEFVIGVVGSLGERQCPEALAALQNLANDETYDPRVRLAAVEMLANFPEPANDAIIVAMARCPHPPTKIRAAQARVRLAETLHKAGKKAEARRIYQAIKACECDHPAQTKAAKMALQSL